MKFFRTFLAALLAVVVGGIITTFILIGSGVSMLASMGSTTPINNANSSVLCIDLTEGIVDSPATSPLGSFDPQSLTMSAPITLLEALTAIERATTDDQIKGILIRQDGLGIISTTTIEELKVAIERFKAESGKWVVAYDDSYTQSEYYLATSADYIMLHPEGALDLRGIAFTTPFFKRALDKLDAEVEVFRPTVCRYKSAVEPYILDKMSDANRKQMAELTESMWQTIASSIATSRNLEVEEVKTIAATLAASMPQDALNKGLVDCIAYEDKMEEELIARGAKTNSKGQVEYISLGEYSAFGNKPYVATLGQQPIASKPFIAIVYADGQIVDGNMEQDGYIYGTALAAKLRQVRLDENTKAVVLRVNSPGGSALASDIVWREMELLKREKPVVVSMGEYAASGGYYISAPADKIVANNLTLTGSIGVFGMIPNLEKTLKNRLGITFDTVATSPSAAPMALYKSLSDSEKEQIMKGVNRVYEVFTTKVAEGRNLAIEDVYNIAEGRVWSGTMAVENGLVDSIGGLHAAIAEASALADVKDFALYEFRTQLSPFEEWLTMFSQSQASLMGIAYSAELESIIKENIDIFTTRGIQTIMPNMKINF